MSALALLASARRILVASAEPWGDYHSAHMAAHYAPVPVIHLTPGELPKDAAGHRPGPRALPADLTTAEAGDVLVLTGSTGWPAQVRQMFPKLPAAALRLAYLAPETVASTGVDLLWGASEQHARELAEHFGASPSHVEVGRYPWEPPVPIWEPQSGSVLLVTSVSEADATGGSAGSANDILHRAGALLQDAGMNVAVAPHPREDLQRWERFQLSAAPTLEAAATAACVVTVAGTAVEAMARTGVPLAIIPAPLAPQHLYEYGTVVRTAEEAVGVATGAVFAGV